jgi:hypothetical protein
MRAIVVDPPAGLGCGFADIAEPSLSEGQVLVAVTHVSLNRGDLNDARSGRLAPGAVLGSDVAGTITRTVADGSGPAVGTRVVALAAGAFAERCAVDATALAPLHPTVDPAHAAALPVAGLAALQALRAAGLAPGKRVLVTGASGGVGHFAVQIAAHVGAHVIASVGSPGRGDDLTDAGANEIVIGLDGIHELLDIVLDNVGGSTLTGASKIADVVPDRRPRRRRPRHPRHPPGSRPPHRRHRLARIMERLGPSRGRHARANATRQSHPRDRLTFTAPERRSGSRPCRGPGILIARDALIRRAPAGPPVTLGAP